ncbi:lipocalin-like domain-containing protein [Enterovirga sp.]|uniref:lipocalin-like domain-containing protein n=1 Tax=Enterovirga sp. TaxID=2026350 RepID=UPI002C750981|nr:lipocalin-like domain-containing protein [Enterovirga sp.]HMO29054.1 lipocalin-like domain-containing protein [Enterovirga sp.]
MADSAELLGTWKMLSWTRTSIATGEVQDALGPDPVGYIAYHADGRMMAFVQRRDRPIPDGPLTQKQKADLFDSMLAYTASYTIEDETVIHTVDGSWNPVWGREPLVRPFKLAGNKLVISGAPGRDPVTGDDVIYRMIFERVRGAPSS